MSIILIGFKNCGKTSVGKLMSEKTKMTFIDTDCLIEKYYESHHSHFLTTREIYQLHGSYYFRELEKNVIANLDNKENIVATGGGSVLYKENVNQLKKRGKIFYLSLPIEELLKRLKADSMPAFLNKNNPEENFCDIYYKRENIYKKIADTQIYTESKSIKDIAEEILFQQGIKNGK